MEFIRDEGVKGMAMQEIATSNHTLISLDYAMFECCAVNRQLLPYFIDRMVMLGDMNWELVLW